MLKTLLAGTAAVVMASATPVLAQQAQNAPAGSEAQARSPHPVLSTEELLQALREMQAQSPHPVLSAEEFFQALSEMQDDSLHPVLSDEEFILVMNEAQIQSPHPILSAEDLQAFADARIAALKAGLKLTPEQEKNWPVLETALRNLQKSRAEQMQQRRAAQGDNAAQRDAAKRDLIETMRVRANVMVERATTLKQVVDAAEPLYRSLDDGQKRRFNALLRQAMSSTHDDSRHGMGPRGKRGFDMRGRGPGTRGMGPRDGMGPRGGMIGPRGGMGRGMGGQ